MVSFFSHFLAPFRKKEDPESLSQPAATPVPAIPSFYVQLAVYDSTYNPPRVLYISSDDFSDLTHNLANEAFSFAASKGGEIPYVAVKEIMENLIHAQFKDVVITILSDGNTIRIADRGPGITDKEKVFLPGFSTATVDMKRYIKGVGSGLTIAREAIAYFGGEICIEDNLGSGCVITLVVPTAAKSSSSFPPAEIIKEVAEYPPVLIPTVISNTDLHHKSLNERLTSRQKKILLLIAEINETGPSSIAKELDMSLSTAYRELVYLEELKLVVSLNSGKRKLSKSGLAYIGFIFE
jgi:hypothetical protein